MIKRQLIFIILCMSTLVTMADEQINIVLSEDHPKKATEYPGFCNIFVTMGDTDDDGTTPVSIQIENISESSQILLFDRAYSEKNLKDMSIVFHKQFPGNKGNRVIESADDLNELILIEPGQKRILPKLIVDKEKSKQCRLPLYVAKTKEKKILKIFVGKTKMEIADKNIIEMNIKVEIKADENIIRLNEEFESLQNELKTKSFINCPNNTHASSLKKQKAPYHSRINKIKGSIDSVLTANGWTAADKEFASYDELRRKVGNIDLSEHVRKCNKHHHVIPIHNCQYCNKTLSQILKAMERTYKQLDNRRITKEAALTEANKLINACSEEKCPLNKKWKNGGIEKNSIENYYNRIKNF